MMSDETRLRQTTGETETELLYGEPQHELDSNPADEQAMYGDPQHETEAESEFDPDLLHFADFAYRQRDELTASVLQASAP